MIWACVRAPGQKDLAFLCIDVKLLQLENIYLGKFLLRMCACFSENVPKDFINMKCQWRVILVDSLWPSVQARCVSWRRTSLLCLWVYQRAAASFLPMHSSLCSYHTKDRPFLPKGDTPAVEMMPSVLKSLLQLLLLLG